MITNKIIQSFHVFFVFILLLSVFLAGQMTVSTSPVFAAEKDCEYRERVPNDGDIANVLGQAYIEGNPDGINADAAENLVGRKERGETWLFISCGNKPEDKYYMQGSLSDAQVGAGDAVDAFFINEVYGAAHMLTPDSLHDTVGFVVSGLWIVNTENPGIMKNSSCDSSIDRDIRRSTTCRRTLGNVAEATPWLAINTDPDNPN